MLGADVAARDRVAAIAVKPPALEHLDIGPVETPEALFRKGRGRTELTRTKSGERSIKASQESLDPLEAIREGYKSAKPHSNDLIARQGPDAGGVLENPGDITTAAFREITRDQQFSSLPFRRCFDRIDDRLITRAR